jgi:acyl-homoserine lactone acylase PvdQ
MLATLSPSLLFAATAYGDGESMAYGSVELMRDSWGVPHVFSETDAGAMYGLGYAAAEDRGFQMYYFLRMIQGRMSEVFGIIEKKRGGGASRNDTLQHDRLMRAFGFAPAANRVVANLDRDSLALLEAYSKGVNDYFAAHEDRTHYLFGETGLVREPWTPADCVLSWWHFAQFFAKDGLRDHPSLSPPSLPRARMAPVLVDDEAAVVRREDVSDDWVAKVDAWVTEMGLVAKPRRGADTPDPKFSHAWVVGGQLTTNGASILVSDPQTPVWNPNMLYEFHAQGATFNARGVGVAGSPIILIGFNESVAWGLTALGADQADLFLLTTDADHPGKYQVDGEWLEMTTREEVIRVKDGDPETMIVRETIFGPVVSQFVFRNPDRRELALRRVPMVETDRETLQGALGMMRARSCEEFAAALPGWRFPTANCIFGDKQGNIGYWSLGALPVRSALTGADGGHAQDGSTREGMWRGMIPYDILPHCMNPKRGYLVTANHRTIPSFYRVPFGNMTGSSGDTDRGLRIKERIAEHLEKQNQFSSDDVLAIHHDTVNVWKREIVRLGLKMLDQQPDRLSDGAKQALGHLRSWYEAGAGMDMTVPGTALMNEVNVIFRGGVFALVNKYGGGVSGLARFAKTVRARDAADPEGAVPEAECEFVDQVLDQAWKRTQAKYGRDPELWQSRAQKSLCRQTLGYMESLDGFPALDPQHNVTLPLLRTIDGSTVLSQKAQAYTQFVPLHNTDEAVTILPFGNSDDPRSAYRFSTYGDWSQGRLHPAPLSRSAVAKLAVSRETLGTSTQSETRRPAERGQRGEARASRRDG